MKCYVNSKQGEMIPKEGFEEDDREQTFEIKGMQDLGTH